MPNVVTGAVGNCLAVFLTQPLCQSIGHSRYMTPPRGLAEGAEVVAGGGFAGSLASLCCWALGGRSRLGEAAVAAGEGPLRSLWW